MAERETGPMVGGLRDDDLEGRNWKRVQARHVSDADWKRFEGYMSEILQAMGMPLNTPGTARTPMRYLRAMFDSTEGYEGDAKLVTAFPTECHGGPDCDLSQVGRKRSGEKIGRLEQPVERLQDRCPSLRDRAMFRNSSRSCGLDS